MAYTRYSFALATARDDEQLQSEITALGFGGFVGCGGGAGTVWADFTAPLTAPQQATLAATVAAHVPGVNNVINRLRGAAVAYFQDQADRQQLLSRAIVLVTVDEVNALRDWITSFKVAVAAASSLADLKVRVAALDAMPDRTEAQAKAAVVNKLNSGGAD